MASLGSAMTGSLEPKGREEIASLGEGKKERKGEKGAFIKNTEGLSLERMVFALEKSCKAGMKLQVSFAINEQKQSHFTSSARISKCFTSTQ